MQDQETKVKIVGPQTGLTRQLLNSLITFKATAADTNGIYALFEIDTPPGEGMLPHLQQYDDETFWVLEGTYRFLVGDQELDLGVGGYAFVPRGMVHGFLNSGRSTARMLSFITPGGIHERFFTEAGKPAAESRSILAPPDPADLPRIAKIAQKYGIEMLLPPST
jgi:mannose-6-phosphate isomerase-like protein (cupin superfamily)